VVSIRRWNLLWAEVERVSTQGTGMADSLLSWFRVNRHRFRLLTSPLTLHPTAPSITISLITILLSLFTSINRCLPLT
jgi:hypothetical protein